MLLPERRGEAKCSTASAMSSGRMFTPRVVRRVVGVGALAGEDREQAHEAGRALVLAAQAEQRVEEALVIGERAGDALGVVVVAERQQLEEQMLLGREVVQEPRLAEPDAGGDRRQRRAVEPLRGEHVVRRGEDRVAPLAALRISASAGAGHRRSVEIAGRGAG